MDTNTNYRLAWTVMPSFSSKLSPARGDLAHSIAHSLAHSLLAHSNGGICSHLYIIEKYRGKRTAYLVRLELSRTLKEVDKMLVHLLEYRTSKDFDMFSFVL